MENNANQTPMGFSQRLDFQYLIMSSLNRLHVITTTQEIVGQGKYEIDVHLSYGIRVLESFLSPYADKKYNEEIAEFDKKAGAKDMVWLVTRLSIVCNLIHRLNLLKPNVKTGGDVDEPEAV